MAAPAPHITRLKDFYLTRLEATGGIGELYRAWLLGEAGFDKLVNIKMLLPHLAGDAVMRERFLDEARLASQLQHQKIVQIYDLGVVEGDEPSPDPQRAIYFHAKEYVHGKSLAALARRAAQSGQPLTPALAAYVVLCAAQALDYIHHFKDQLGRPLGIVHASISPVTILVAYEGAVKLTDFSAARGGGFEAVGSAVGAAGHTGLPQYMSPEQVAGYPLDARSDLYSLGAVLWELLAGRRLVDSEDRAEVERMISEEEFPSPSQVNPEAPTGLETVAMRCLARQRDLRYPEALAMAADLEAYLVAAQQFNGASELKKVMQELFAGEIASEQREYQEELALLGRITQPPPRPAGPAAPSEAAEPTRVSAPAEEDAYAARGAEASAVTAEPTVVLAGQEAGDDGRTVVVAPEAGPAGEGRTVVWSPDQELPDDGRTVVADPSAKDAKKPGWLSRLWKKT